MYYSLHEGTHYNYHYLSSPYEAIVSIHISFPQDGIISKQATSLHVWKPYYHVGMIQVTSPHKATVSILVLFPT